MKQIQFQHFRKAPHPFQQYGNIPPAALRNRSLPKDYSSLPQGQQAFTQKGGKKQYNIKYETTDVNDILKSYNDDTLSKQMANYSRRIMGKSLQTNDIQGAQGGSLKSPAVKYKEIAQKLKMKGVNQGFDKYQYQQEQYRRNIQNAIKAHDKDVSIGKFISYKGHGHYLNPEKEKDQKKKKFDKINESQKPIQNNYQPYLKMKHTDFTTKDQEYKHFFTEKQDQQEDYSKFFNKIKREPQYSPVFYGSLSGLKQEKQAAHGYKTLDLQNQKRQLQFYQPKNFPKRSLQSQFQHQQSLGIGFDYSQKNGLNKQINQMSNSRKIQIQQLTLNQLRNQEKIHSQKSRIVRRFNPTNLSAVIDSDLYRSNIY